MQATSELRPLLPDDWRLPEKEAFLVDMRETVQSCVYPGYPARKDRLYIANEELKYTYDWRPIFPADPNAPYAVFEHSAESAQTRPVYAFHDTGKPLPIEELEQIRWMDMHRDSRGFPLHRYAVEMVTDSSIGGVIGPGYYHHPGKMLTVDLGVAAIALPAEGNDDDGVTPAIRIPESRLAHQSLYLAILMVQRSDTKQLALPGGDLEKSEEAKSAALREAREEAGLNFARELIVSLGRRVVADPRLTTCTETETELFFIDAGEIPEAKPLADGHEVTKADWLIADSNLLIPGRCFGSHRRMLFEVVSQYQRKYDVTVMSDGSVVDRSAE